jgi:hypothetical protein
MPAKAGIQYAQNVVRGSGGASHIVRRILDARFRGHDK